MYPVIFFAIPLYTHHIPIKSSDFRLNQRLTCWMSRWMRLELSLEGAWMTGWWLSPTPLKNMKVSWKYDIPNWMESHKSHVPNHQPVCIYIYICMVPKMEVPPKMDDLEWKILSKWIFCGCRKTCQNDALLTSMSPTSRWRRTAAPFEACWKAALAFSIASTSPWLRSSISNKIPLSQGPNIYIYIFTSIIHQIEQPCHVECLVM